MKKKEAVKLASFVAGLISIALLHMGAQWQHEIAFLNLCNGWEFGWFFRLWMMDNWVAMDFFRAVQDVCLVSIGLLGIGFGYWLKGVMQDA